MVLDSRGGGRAPCFFPRSGIENLIEALSRGPNSALHRLAVAQLIECNARFGKNVTDLKIVP